MAELSKRLPVDMRGYVEPAAAKPAPSFLESLARAGSQAIGAIQEGNAQSRRRKAAAADAAETDVKNLAAEAYVYTTTGKAMDPRIEQAVKQAQDLAPKILSQQEAVNQGKGNAAAVRVRAEAMVREGMSLVPDQYRYVYLKALKEFGVDSIHEKDYARAETAIDQEITEENRIQSKYADTALELGYGDYTKMTEAEKAAVRPKIDKYNEGLAKLKQAEDLVRLKTAQVNLSEAEKKQLEAQEDDLRVRGFMDTMGPMAHTFITNIGKVLTDPQMSDPEKQEAINKLGAFADIELPRLFGQMLGLYGGGMTSESRTLVTQQFETLKRGIQDMVSGEASVLKQNERMMKVLTDEMGIEVHKALPFWSYLKSAVGGETLSTLFTNDVLGNPEIKEKLKTEFRMAEQLAPGEDRLRFNNIVKILKGEGKLIDYTPEQVKQMAPVVLKSMNAMSHNSAITNGTDEQSHRDFMRSIENAASIAVEATPQWGYKSLMQVGEVFMQQGVQRGLVGVTKNREERSDAINSYQPALQNLHNALSSTKSGDRYYDLVWDNKNLRWGYKWNGQKQQSGAINPEMSLRLGVDGKPTTVGMVQPTPSQAIIRQAHLLNLIVDSQVKLSKGGWDPTVPNELSDRDRRLYYGQGVMPKVEKEEKPENMQQSVDRLIQEFSAGLNASGPYKKGDVTDLPTAADIASKHEKNPNFAAMAPVIEGEAKAIDMPMDVAMRLFDAESGFRPDAESKAGAYGPGQITPATAKLYGVDDIKSLSPEQNIKLAFRILKDNFKRFGNWADAISAYHSGRSLAAAAAAGANDGLMATKDYVAKIAGDLL